MASFPTDSELRIENEKLKAKLDATLRQLQQYEANAGKEKLPMTLGEALEKLDKDKLIQGALPGDMLRVFTEYKRDEWEEFLATPTQWDLDKYLDCLP